MLKEKKRNANIGVGVGFLFQIVCKALWQGAGIGVPLIGLIGTCLIIWGCFNYAEGKGYTKWLGLFGLLSIIGLVILACLPDKRKDA